MKFNRQDSIALISGMALPLAFAPFYLSLLGFIAPALLLNSWLQTSAKRAFRRGFLFGLGFFGIGISWVYVSIHVFGEASIALSLFITLIFVCFLALFFACLGLCLNKFFPENNLIKLLLAFPCLWLIFELLRTWLFTGFPWLLLGYSQTNTWLKGFAPLFSVYGISLITTFISGALVAIYHNKQSQFRLYYGICILGVLFAGFFFAHVKWTHPASTPLKATLIQGNVSQNLKWQPEQFLKTLGLYAKYTSQSWSSDIIVWPEAAITLPLNQMTEYLQDLDNLAKQKNATIITGIPVVTPLSSFNAMIAIGKGSGEYHKRHLVPFGEYIPLKPFYGPFLTAFNIPMSNLERGANKQLPLMAKGIAIAPYICYEIAYPVEFLSFLPKAQLLLTITDDSWFGHSIAAKQHLQMAQMRALETGRYLMFSSNTGITAVINEQGDIIDSLPDFEEAVLTESIQPMDGVTPWMIWRLLPLLAVIFVMVAIGARRYIKKLR